MTQQPEREPCFSCGALVPATDGTTHDHMLSSPGCWAIYGEVLAREYERPAYMADHRLTVDAYAVQHPGEPGWSAAYPPCSRSASSCASSARSPNRQRRIRRTCSSPGASPTSVETATCAASRMG